MNIRQIQYLCNITEQIMDLTVQNLGTVKL